MTATEFRRWMKINGYSIAGAADALGLSARQVAYYRAGEQEIPRVVELACAQLTCIEEKKKP